MRIISGKYKGRRIIPPTKITARPTTDFAKESLFNLIENRICIDGIDVLDLFSGTGSIGIEFISRGANSVVSVEKAHVQQNFIISTCKGLGIDNLTLVRDDAFRYIKSCQRKFDLIFADPPYQLDTLPTLPNLIFEKELLKDGGWFIMEHSAKDDFSNHPHFVSHRQYGSVNFSFFQ